MLINLSDETEAILKQHNYTFKAIKYVANAEGLVDIARFITLAKLYTYDNNGPELMVDPTLVVVGGSWWLSRIINNNQEQWLFHKKPKRPTVKPSDFCIKVYRGENKKHSFNQIDNEEKTYGEK